MPSMITRRRFLKSSALTAAACVACGGVHDDPAGVELNDIHSRLNATRVREVARPASIEQVIESVVRARRTGASLSIAGGRHAMGGQQFGRDTLHLDMRAMSRESAFDADRGLLEMEAGAMWPDVVDVLERRQGARAGAWGFLQKQTGADRLTLGGSLAANVHGRGLTLPPIVAQVEAFSIVTADGEIRRCSRTENGDLFAAAIGGYGLFGVMAAVSLRLARRGKVERVVEVIDSDSLPERFAERIAAGFTYGDFQYATDAASEDFLRRGVFSCYRPVEAERPMPVAQRELAESDWRRLLMLAHTDRTRAFEEYAAYYLGTSGQIYWSDTHQMSVYLDDYHAELDRTLGASAPGSEMITEIYVPRASLPEFLSLSRGMLRERDVPVIYGTIRLIEKDTETLLAWAREAWACTIFNLHVEHTPAGVEKAAGAFRDLIDLAIELGGSYYPTYHRWATREQVEKCHPGIRGFLAAKKRHDPDGLFQSEWHRHAMSLFAES